MKRTNMEKNTIAYTLFILVRIDIFKLGCVIFA